MAEADGHGVPLGRLGPLRGSARDVSVTLTGLSYRASSAGPRYPYPDFGSDFIEALHKSLTAPVRRGFLWSTLACPWCDSRLDAATVGQVSLNFEMSLKRIPPIQVEIEMPGVPCPACGRSLVMIDDSTIDAHLSDALLKAFASVGFGRS